ncbi:MAG: hypothetical protein ABIJ30_06580 [bacterium]
MYTPGRAPTLMIGYPAICLKWKRMKTICKRTTVSTAELKPELQP